MANDTLSKLLSSMDLPAHRKMSRSPDNLRWLLKNLGARNSQNPNYNAALAEVRAEAENQNVSV